MPFYIPFIVASLGSLFLSTSAASNPQHRSNGLPLPSHLVRELPNPTWVENIAVKASGQLLTLLTVPDLYYLDPANPSDPKLMSTFPSLGVLGITKLTPDHFYVLGTNFSLATKTQPSAPTHSTP